jgi:hypothetical protein
MSGGGAGLRPMSPVDRLGAGGIAGWRRLDPNRPSATGAGRYPDGTTPREAPPPWPRAEPESAIAPARFASGPVLPMPALIL